ncbi:MAG: T9SS type B sorting domain-containing protein [Sphingobacteriales bacterium]|nr:MAG: T9SS type B sorting domain-containing protein [Sphingobacteriales bacterium]
MKQFYFLLLFVFTTHLLVAQDCGTISGDVTPANTTICEGNSVLLTATGGSSYEWHLNGMVIDGETTSTLSATLPGTYSVIIKEGECAVPASNTASVNVTPNPTGTISPATGSICAGGGAVTLTATGGDSYTWYLNNVEIPGQTSNTLSATQAGTYSAIIRQGDCSAAASNTANITSSPTPTGTISPATGSICPGGGTIRLTATGGDTYTWYRNGVEIAGETDRRIDVSEGGSYSVLIHQGNCSGQASNTSEITEAASPTGAITPAAATFCEGGSVMLNATGGDSYRWFRDGNRINGQTGETLSVNREGTYTVEINQGDCVGVGTNSAVVTMTARPEGNIAPAFTSVCAGGAVELTASGGTSYTWYLNGAEIAGQTGAVLNATQAGLYSATIHDGDCSAAAENSSLVTFTPVPVGNISPATGTVCEGQTTILTATGGNSYAWFKNGVEIAGETRSTLEISEAGTYTATIKQGVCSGPALNAAVITSAPLPSGSITPLSDSICPGASTVLTATGGTSYTWFRNGNEIRRETGAALTVTQAGTYTATIRQGGCTAPASNSVAITLATVPSGTITPATASFCPGGAAVLTASGGASYSWFLNGVVIAGQNGPTFNAILPGKYTAVIKQGECSAPAANSSTVTVATTPTGIISPASAIICGGGSTVLTATGGTSYTWLLNDVVIEGQESATLTATQPGDYKIIIRNGTCEGPGSNTVKVTAEDVVGTTYPTVTARIDVATPLEARNIGVSYEWTPPTGLSNPLSRTPTVTTNSDKLYIVKITTQSGCVVSDTVAVTISSTIFVATGFTPNSNGKNDLLRPVGALKSIESFRVFNRWGQLMFQTNQINAGWDGKFKGELQRPDAYTWYLIATGTDGKTVKISGKTYLIR